MDKKLESFIKKERKKIPKEYNQVMLIDDIFSEKSIFNISISNRSDGKTSNYVHLLLKLSIKFDSIKLFFISRTFFVRESYVELMYSLCDLFDDLDVSMFKFRRTQEYIQIIYGDKSIAIISDLNNATDLKYHSSFIKEYPIIVYDEFLALAGDYLDDEWNQLKTIYESVDKVESRPLLPHPKILLMGNAVNFDSPLISELDLFKILESQKINTKKTYGDITLELLKNESANNKRNLTAFNRNSGQDDAMATAQFNFNNYLIASKSELNNAKKTYDKIVIKGRTNFYIFYSNIKKNEYILSVKSFQSKYDYNFELEDSKEESTFLSSKFFTDKFVKNYQKEFFKFDNSYSKNKILGNDKFKRLNLFRLAPQKESSIQKAKKLEKALKDDYIEKSKRAIFARMFQE
jgi:hypothetical protein